jgi:hypothetical protein
MQSLTALGRSRAHAPLIDQGVDSPVFGSGTNEGMMTSVPCSSPSSVWTLPWVQPWLLPMHQPNRSQLEQTSKDARRCARVSGTRQELAKLRCNQPRPHETSMLSCVKLMGKQFLHSPATR